jgi:hypothetical protein
MLKCRKLFLTQQVALKQGSLGNYHDELTDCLGREGAQCYVDSKLDGLE